MSFDRLKHSQKIGSRLKEKRGTAFFAEINPRRKLKPDQIKKMLEEFDNRSETKKTVDMIASKYKITPANVYYHARRR